MADIDQYLEAIKNAVYGRDVRDAIHDGIEAINDEVEDFVQGDMDTTLTSATLPAQGKAVGDAFAPVYQHRTLPSGVTDLDGITTVGAYILGMSTAYTNCPVGTNTRRLLIVFGRPDATFRMQALINMSDGAVYTRTNPSTSWGAWNTRNYTKSLTNGEDLDGLSEHGGYTSAQGNVYVNQPPQDVDEQGQPAGGRKYIWIDHYNVGTTVYYMWYYSYTNNKLYVREHRNSSWGEWKDLIGNIDERLDESHRFARRDTIATAGFDLDDLYLCGWYMIQQGTSVLNSPENATGYRMILVFQGVGDEFRNMLYINRTTGFVAMRTHTSSGWIQGWTVISPGLDVVLNKAITPQYGRKMYDICHRGYSGEAPENSLLAFKLARKYGFDWIECDIQFTSDNVPVIMHNRNLAGTNSPARNADGSIIEGVDGVLNIDSITYDQALTYDFGIKRGAQFAGMQIASLADALDLFRHVNLSAMLHFKETVTTAERRQIIYNMVAQYGMTDNVILMSGSKTTLTNVSKEVSNARIALSNDPSYCNDTLVPYLQSLQVNGNEVWLTSNKDVYPDGIVYVDAANAAGFPVTCRLDDATQAESYRRVYHNVFITNGVGHFVPSEYLYGQYMADVTD